MKKLIYYLQKLVNWLTIYHQSICNHKQLRYVQDAWDYEYICVNCTKSWFNEKPSYAVSGKVIIYGQSK